MLAAAVGLCGLALQGCASHGAAASRLPEPVFDPQAWFQGDTYAYGMFEGRGGAANLGFRTWLHEAATEDGFTLRERFLYDDGLRWERSWSFRRAGPGVFDARAENVAGVGRMTVSGDVARLVYDADMPTGHGPDAGSGATVRLRFDMVLNRLGAGMVVNRAFVSKFGLGLGRLTMVFVKPGADWPEAAAIAAMPPFPVIHAKP